MVMKKRCPKCNELLDKDATFCTECGTNVKDVVPEEVPETQTGTPTQTGAPTQTGTPTQTEAPVTNPKPAPVKPQVIVVQSLKSMGLGLLLTLIFGPLGMLYSSIIGAVIMFVVSAVVGFLTLGLGLIVIWPICLGWTYAAIKKHNNNLMSGKFQDLK
jgi:hypothetical protein